MTSHNRPRIQRSLLLALALACPYYLAGAGEAAAGSPGETSGAEGPPGDSTILERTLDAGDLAAFEYVDVMRALRAVPGVYLQDEEGFGLRPNIAIQGHGLYRSAHLSLMEDGVPAAPAPYAAPQAYYFPTFRRMAGVSVLSGPASIAAGSRSAGGALNLASSTIPESFGGGINSSFNENEFVEVIAKAGDSRERWGWLAETVQVVDKGYKELQSDLGAKTGYTIADYLLRLRLEGDPGASLRQALEFKLGHTSQDGWETYLGLTDADFQANPRARYAGSQLDRLRSAHQLYQATYSLVPAEDNWELAVTAYRNNFDHNWYKLESVNGNSIAAILDDPAGFGTEMDWIRGGNSPDDALALRDNGSDYYSQGLQAQLAWEQELARMQIDWQATLIAHQDQEDRLHTEDGYRMEDNTLILTATGTAGNAANLVSEGQSLAAIIQADLHLGAWTVAPVLRVEDIQLTRKEFALDDPQRAGSPLRSAENSVRAFAPGLGLTYRLNERWQLNAGVHKGFGAPLPGAGAGEEENVNLTGGAAFQSQRLAAQLTGFVTDYSHLVATCQDYQVGFCPIDQQTDYGKARISGVTALVGQTIPDILEIGLAFDWHLRYTYSYEAVFNDTYVDQDGAWGAVESGDSLPYIPDHQFQAGAGVRRNKWGINLIGNYVSETRTLPGRGSIPAAESTDASLVLDLLADFWVSDDLRVYMKIDNVTDEANIVARRPAGARPNAPRAFGVGVHFRF